MFSAVWMMFVSPTCLLFSWYSLPYMTQKPSKLAFPSQILQAAGPVVQGRPAQARDRWMMWMVGQLDSIGDFFWFLKADNGRQHHLAHLSTGQQWRQLWRQDLSWVKAPGAGVGVGGIFLEMAAQLPILQSDSPNPTIPNTYRMDLW